MMGTNQNASYGRLLARTYLHTVTAYRPVPSGEALIWENRPCALSRAAHTSAPTPDEKRAILPEAAYRYVLYTDPGVPFQLGDRVEVTDGACVYHGRTSDSFRYPTHCVTVVEILEVEHGQNT